jgi:hypothetical protein
MGILMHVDISSNKGLKTSSFQKFSFSSREDLNNSSDKSQAVDLYN